MVRLLMLGALLLATLYSAAGAFAQGRTLFGQSVPSPTLGRPIPYALYLPANAPPEGQRWPVVYLLHGLTGRDGDWFTWGNLSTILDRLISTGAIRPIMVVAPGAGDSWYVDNPDSGGLGRMETALTADLVPAIDHAFPTVACREGRAVGGVSMGGYGALLLSLHHPELFEAAIGLSASVAEPMRPHDPRLGAPFLRELYKGAYGEPLDPSRFNELNLFEIATKLTAGTTKPAIWISIGLQDYPELVRAHRKFAAMLEKKGFSVEQRYGEGRHFWDYWQTEIDPALVWLSPQLAKACP